MRVRRGTVFSRWCIIKCYQEISRATRKARPDKSRQNFVLPAIPQNRRRSDKQTLSLLLLFVRFSRSLSSTLDWSERLLFQAKASSQSPALLLSLSPSLSIASFLSRGNGETPFGASRGETKCFPGRLARQRRLARLSTNNLRTPRSEVMGIRLYSEEGGRK